MSNTYEENEMARRRRSETTESATVGISTEEKTTEPAETPKPKPKPDAKINVQTFCAIKKYPRSIVSRLEIYLLETKDTKKERTVSDWEKVYDKAMNRITK